jgi:hypothetical protein
MRVVVLGCNGAGSRSHYVTGYRGPGVSVWMSFIFIPHRDCFLCYSVIYMYNYLS